MNTAHIPALLALLIIGHAPASAALIMDTVRIGNAGNHPDSTGLGAVDNSFSIGKYEVTNAQYVEFLNSADPSGDDPLQLWPPTPTSRVRSGILRNSAAPEGSKYETKLGRENNPVVFISWFSAARFVNWLHNGQGNGDTENGAYTLLGNTPRPSNGTVVSRNPGAKWFLPSEDEWYKAAYHKNNGVTGDYWDYPTSTNSTPFSDQAPGTGAPDPSNTINVYKDDDVANGYDDGYAVTGDESFPTGNAVTDVGAYALSKSAYGTFDQGGNVFEWTESPTTVTYRIRRGGDWSEDYFLARKVVRGAESPDSWNDVTGFRVARALSVPELETARSFSIAMFTSLFYATYSAAKTYLKFKFYEIPSPEISSNEQ